MKVLLVVRWPVGGIRTYLRYVYSQPCFAGLEFIVITPAMDLQPFMATVFVQNQLTYMETSHNNRDMIRAIRAAVRQHRPDMLHSHGFSSALLSEVALIANQVPHLMTAHDVLLPQQFTGWQGRIKHWITARLFARLDAIHTVTKEAEDNFVSFFPALDPAKIHGILHGIDTAFFRDGSAQDLRALHQLPQGRPLIGFFGRFMAQKGFRDLVDAMRLIVQAQRLSPLPLVVTFGWGGFVREDYAYVEARGMKDYFVQLPGTDDMPGALKGVDLVAMPSRWEACGLLAMEALAAGVPIVGTDCVGLNEVLDKTPATRIKPYAPEALADALVDYLQHSKKQAFLDYQPVACVRFEINRPANGLRQLYQDLLAIHI